MQEIFFLLLPVAALYGWYMGARSAYQKSQTKGNNLSRDYVKGLNFLLNEEPDKAVDHFIALLKVDDDTIDTHLALGNLFRQRGEVERAIRIHQNLIARPTLTREQRDLALLQLGTDFYQSGLFDRSEEIFTQLKASPEYQQLALENLLLIHQQLKDWNEAVTVAEALNKLLKGKSNRRTLSYLYCCLAEQLTKPEEQQKKVKLYKKALATYSKCISASVGLANYYETQGEPEKALQVIEKVPESDLDFTSTILEQLWRLHQQLGTEQALVLYLYRIVGLGGGASAVIMLSKLIAKNKSVRAAHSFILQELQRNPTMKGFNHLMTYHLQLAESESEKESLSFLQKLVAKQVALRPQYRCQKCGFESNKLSWLCPSCRSWGRIKPIRGLDGE